MNSTDRNCLSYWFPTLQAAGVPVPKTEIVHTDADLSLLLDGEIPAGWGNFMVAMDAAIAKITSNDPSKPVFLRTGQTSGKHDWKRTCYYDPSQAPLASHIVAIVEFSHLCSFLGLPHDVWCVRELLPTEPVATLPRYGDMPITTEFRAFVGDGKVQCVHPYWPVGSIAKGLGCTHRTPRRGPLGSDSKCPDCQRLAEELFLKANGMGAGTDGMMSLIHRVADVFAGDGEWSVDVLLTNNGWYVTDMAVAAESYHYEDCPVNAAMRIAAAASSPARPEAQSQSQ